MDVPTYDRVVRIADPVGAVGKIGFRVLKIVVVLEGGILAKGVSDFYSLAAVDRVINIGGHGSRSDITVVPLDKHLAPLHLEGVNSVQGIEIPPRLFSLPQWVRPALTPVLLLHRQLPDI